VELGIDKKQIESMKAALRGLADDRVQLRFVVCLVLLIVGWLAVLRPQSIALTKARKKVVQAGKQALAAEETVFFTRELEKYEPYLFAFDDPAMLQAYVRRSVEASGAQLRSFANKKTEPKGVFQVVELDMDVVGTYSELVHLVDLLEHGDKVLRLEKLKLERTKTSILMECTLNGLVKPSLAPAPAVGGEAEGDGSAEAGGSAEGGGSAAAAGGGRAADDGARDGDGERPRPGGADDATSDDDASDDDASDDATSGDATSGDATSDDATSDDDAGDDAGDDETADRQPGAVGLASPHRPAVGGVGTSGEARAERASPARGPAP